MKWYVTSEQFIYVLRCFGEVIWRWKLGKPLNLATRSCGVLVKALDLCGPQFLHPYHNENVPYSKHWSFFFFFNTCEVFLKNLFISCTGFSLVAASGGYPVVVMYGLIAVASLVAEHRLQGMWASVAVAGGLSSCSSQALEHRLNSCSTQA